MKNLKGNHHLSPSFIETSQTLEMIKEQRKSKLAEIEATKVRLEKMKKLVEESRRSSARQ